MTGNLGKCRECAAMKKGAHHTCSEWVRRQEFELEKLPSRANAYIEVRACRPAGQGPQEIHLRVDGQHGALCMKKFGLR
jgi:hypothetical protein